MSSSDSQSQSNFDFCIYHAPRCTDGLVSAWIVQMVSPDVEMIPCSAGSNPTAMNLNDMKMFKNKNIVFVDVVCTPPYLKVLASLAADIIIIDHHKSYKDDLKRAKLHKLDNVHHIFNDKKAACQLVWETLLDKATVPWFVNYVAERDLYQETLPHSKAICQALYDGYHIRSFEGLDNLYEMDEQEVGAFKRELIRKGSATLTVRNDLVKASAKGARHVKFGEYHAWMYTCPSFLVSDVGARLMRWTFRDRVTQPDFTVHYSYDVEKCTFKLAFRSGYKPDHNGEDESVDVSDIARQVSSGGGGHRYAAACTLPGTVALRDYFQHIYDQEYDSEASDPTEPSGESDD